MKRTISMLLTLVVALGMVAIPVSANPVVPAEFADVVASATPTDTFAYDAASLDRGLRGANSTWIVNMIADIEFAANGGTWIEGNGYNNRSGEPTNRRKLSLYAQDADRNVTEEFTLTIPMLYVIADDTTVMHGTLIGEIYVNSMGFDLRGTEVIGNVYFETAEQMESAVMRDGAAVSGKWAVRDSSSSAGYNAFSAVDTIGGATSCEMFAGDGATLQDSMKTVEEGGVWIVNFMNDIDMSGETLVIEGDPDTFQMREANPDGKASIRKLALYSQGSRTTYPFPTTENAEGTHTAGQPVSDNYDLFVDKIEVRALDTRLQYGRIVGDVYVYADKYRHDTVLEGNLYFETRELWESANMSSYNDGAPYSKVTGTIALFDGTPLHETAVPLPAPAPAPAPEAAAGYASGTFTGTARGFGGDITVTVTVADGKITAIDAQGSSETPPYWAMVNPALPNAIVEANSPDVDVISDATSSSNGVINAVKAALDSASAPAAPPAPVAPPAAAGSIQTGLGIFTSTGAARTVSATAEAAGGMQVDSTIAVLALEGGVITKAIIDSAQTRVTFDANGVITSDRSAPVQTKAERGDGYGMRNASAARVQDTHRPGGAGMEWFEQAEALNEWLIGKTPAEVLAMPTYQLDASHPAVPDVEDLWSSVTIDVGDMLKAIRKAAENTVAGNASGSYKTGLGVVTKVGSSQDAVAGTLGGGGTYTVVEGDFLARIARNNNTTYQELARINNIANPNLIFIGQVINLPGEGAATDSRDGRAQVDSTVVAVTVDANNVIVAAVIDVAQTRMGVNASGELVGDKFAARESKGELGDRYNMLNASRARVADTHRGGGAGLEWYAQVDAFQSWMVGKTVSEVLGMPTYQLDASHPEVADVAELWSTTTIDVGDMIRALEKAVNSMK